MVVIVAVGVVVLVVVVVVEVVVVVDSTILITPSKIGNTKHAKTIRNRILPRQQKV